MDSMYNNLLLNTTFTALVAVAVVGCGDTDSDIDDAQETTLHFEATVGDDLFACGESYSELGTTETTFEPFDFRLYISAIELRDGSGDWQSLDLDGDSPWQYENIALLDFEDGTGRCTNGTEQTNDVVTGLTEANDIDGLRFQIGVPFEHNHIDVSTAPSPLDQTAMFWNWLGGYKFVRLEGATDGLDNGWQLHLGSTECEPGAGQGAESCANGNRIDVELADFDVDGDTVVFDVAELVAEADLDRHTDNTPAGCMAGPDDPDCTAIFDAMGLEHDSVDAGTPNFIDHAER